MGCNAWNHPPDCDCGWGGDTGGGSSAGRSPGPSDLQDNGLGFLNPNARCPVCSAPVFFYQSPEGGKVYFDELGPPWPKHPCTAHISKSVASFTDLIRFTGADVAPEKAMRMAADLVRHAMRDFREPSRTWPSKDLTAARHELLDWMFRRHSKNANEHMVPLNDFFFIIEMIERRAQGLINLAEIDMSELGDEYRESDEELASWAEIKRESEGTLALMALVRQRYDRGKEGAEVASQLTTEGTKDNVVLLRSKADERS